MKANSAKMDKLGYKPNLKDLEMASDDQDDDDDIYGDEVEQANSDEDSDIEDDMDARPSKK